MSSSPGRPVLPPSAGPEVPPGFVLVVDDEPLLLRALARILGPDGHRIVLAETPGEAQEALGDPALDVVLLDLRLRGADGLDLLDRLKRERPELEVVVMTGHATIESAVGCMRQGAFDYLAKPFDDVHRVRTTVHQAIERRRLLARNRELEARLEGRREGPELIGHAPAMRRLARTIESLRHNESHVLIQGESGTGKELVARALHGASRRRAGPFVPVDCGALPESVIESELFGHERGAFTGAVGAPGLFRMAGGGTLFLDEVGEIPIAMQAKLLRALQYKEVRAVGAAAPVTVDIRVVAATHRDLLAMVETGRFRMDLYYRLHVVRLEIPPLRERIEDVPLLVQHFLDKHARRGEPMAIEQPALERLMSHDWPGNVRELENVIESALALARGPRLRASDLPIGRSRGTAAAAAVAPAPTGLPLSLDAYERSALERALREAGGNATDAARRLGIGRSTFYRKLGKHGVPLQDEGGAGLVGPGGIR
ncbi:MAG: sigma-54 dependent transcriptional regulator [Deltaproteobacteria bacterium]|nr:sigma-54 dependent transcriptional regulator [Deltaproteobacteria bacterium]